MGAVSSPRLFGLIASVGSDSHFDACADRRS
jgi:hypothetical protein